MSLRYEYKDFVLRMYKAPTGYRVAAEGPGGETSGEQRLKYEEIEALQTELFRIKSGIFRLPLKKSQLVGKRLFEALFTGAVREILGSAKRGLQETPEVGLRIKLIIRKSAPELSRLPWELMYHPDEDKFLAFYLSSPIVRFIEGGLVTPGYPLKAPVSLKVLYVRANPPGTQELRGTDYAVLKAAIEGGGGEVKDLPEATKDALRDRLRKHDIDVLHYDGHGEFEDDIDKGVIKLHDGRGGIDDLTGAEMASLLSGREPRLVVLSACRTAMDSKETRFSGVAQEIVRKTKVPAVAAMQFWVPEEYGSAFTREFYEALVSGLPVDAAVVEGRQAIYETIKGEVGAVTDDKSVSPHWATPVLFMQSENGYIFGGKRRGASALVGVSGEITRPQSPSEGGPKYFETDQIECSGTVCGFEPGSMHIWLVVEDEYGNKFPHDKVRQINEEGEWQQQIREQGRSETFNLLLYAIAPELDEKIVEWHNEGAKKGGDFPRFLDFSEAEAEYLDSVEGLRRLLRFSIENVDGDIVEPGRGEAFDTAGIQCSGTVSGPVPGVHLWLFSEVDGQLYPHRGEVKVKDGKWRHRIWEGGTSEDFRLALYALGTRAHFYIEDRVKDKSCALDENDPDDREFFEADWQPLAWAEELRRLLRVSFDDVDVEGSIDAPEPGDKVPDPTQIDCSGTASDPLPDGVHLRLFTEIGGRLYPHRGEVKVEQGAWEHTIRELGESEEFNLVLYALDSRAHFFIKDRHKGRNYSALDRDNPNDAEFFEAECKHLELVQNLRK